MALNLLKNIHIASQLGSTTPKLSNNVPDNISGTRFEDIQNPYTNMPRQQTFWDKFANWFGFRSGYDKALEQYQLSSDEYNAQLSQLASEEKYNSPVEQAQRMRQAGLNPDLTGVSGESASEFDNQQERPDVSGSSDVNPLDVISTIGNAFISTITGTMSLLSDINQYKQAKIATDEKDIDYANKMLQFFKDSYPYLSYQDDGTESDVNVYALRYGNPLFHSKRAVKRFNHFRSSVGNSLLGLTTKYKSYEDFAKSAEEFGKTLSSPWMSNFGSITPSDIASFLKPLSKAQFDLSLAQIKADNARAYKDYHKEGFEGDAFAELNKDPNNAKNMAESIASGNEADIAENRARQSLAPLKSTQAKIYQRMLTEIEKIPDRGIGTSILKFFLSNQLSKGLEGLGSGLKNVAGAITKIL